MFNRGFSPTAIEELLRLVEVNNAKIELLTNMIQELRAEIQDLKNTSSLRSKALTIKTRCAECRDGILQPTDVLKLSNPPKRVYKCDKCNAEAWMSA